MKTPEEIKKGLECCIYSEFECPDECPYVANALNCSKQLLADVCAQFAKVPKWISVEERLPELETEVLVWCGKFVCMAHYGRADSYEPVFWDYDCEGCRDELYPKVTHWMPLPEPPK